MAIPYRTAKFKFANTFAKAICDPTAKFNSRQYFQLYSSCFIFCFCFFTQTHNLSPHMKYMWTTCSYACGSNTWT